MSKKIFLSLIAVIIVGVGLFYYFDKPEDNLTGVTVGTEPLSIVGTRSGTSTLGIYFGKNASNASSTTYALGTTTYPMRINDAKTVLFTFNVTEASSSAVSPYIAFKILGSNDNACDTTNTTDGSLTKKSEINWFDASPFILNLAGSTTLSATTTSLSITPTAGVLTPIELTNLNYKCLSLAIGASSTRIHVQARIKN